MGRGRKVKIELVLLEFLIFLAAFLIPFYLIIIFEIEIQQFKNFQAKLTSLLLSSIGINSASEQNYILVNDKIFEVSWDSTGWKSIYVLTALILATPLSIDKKYKYLVVAPILTLLVNLIRIFITIYSVMVLGMDFNFLHIFLWRYLMGIYIICFWFLFIYNQKYNIGKELYIIGRFYGRRR